MGIATNMEGTNKNLKEIKYIESPNNGEIYTIPNSIVRRDEYGVIVNEWIIDDSVDIRIIPNTEYFLRKITSKEDIRVYTDSIGTSNNLDIMSPVGDYFRLNYSESTILQIRRLGV